MTPNEPPPPAPPAPLDDLLGADAARPRRGRRWAVAAVLLLAAGALAWAWLGERRSAARQVYDTQAVDRGALTVSVSANGTLQPTNQVAVGSELSGTVAAVAVDVNDRVQRGQVLARLDTAKLRDQVTASRAALAAARAAVQQAEATVTEAQAALARLEEVQRLSGGQVPSAAELDTARAALARARANETSARAGVGQAEATLSSNETSLAKASIRSPISGVVLARAVDPGNAVAATLQAVTLFTLAEDLTKMKLQVNVDEADVGQVEPGQSATFTVSAYPNRRYPATITRVSVGSTTQDNVVTYLADLTVDNADLSLRPGMTATAAITTVQRSDVLRVPNAALRFTPQAAAAPADSGGSSIVSALMPRPPRGNAVRRAGTDTSQVRQVWILDQGLAVPVPVLPGVSDGRMTEVTSERLQPGMAVIVGQRSAAP